MFWEYLESGMGGSYWIDCHVIRKLDNGKYLIKYYDTYIEEYVEQFVEADRVREKKNLNEVDMKNYFDEYARRMNGNNKV